MSHIVHTAIVGGDLLFREGLRRILEDTPYRVNVIAPSIVEVIGYRQDLDLLLLLGFSSDDSDLLDALAELRRRRPEMRFVAIAENRADQLIAALNAGLHGYLARYISAVALFRFLSLIMLGQRVFSTKRLNLPKHPDRASIHKDTLHKAYSVRIGSGTLTERERALLAFLVHGRSNKLIARELGIAEATVKAQMVRLFAKIGAANRTQAAVLACASQRAPPLAS